MGRAGHLWNAGLLLKRLALWPYSNMALCATCATEIQPPRTSPGPGTWNLSPISNRRLDRVQVTRARPRPTHRPAREPRARCVRAPPDVPPSPEPAGRARSRDEPSRKLRKATGQRLKVPRSSRLELGALCDCRRGGLVPVPRGGAGTRVPEEPRLAEGRGDFGH